MPTLTIPNIPEELLENIKSRAAANGRALEEEALIRLKSADGCGCAPGVHSDARERTPVMREVTPEEAAQILAQARRARQGMTMIPADVAEVNRCNPEGRLW